MYWYFDDSVQTRGDFVIGAFVASAQTLEQEIALCLIEAGLTPGTDEFKSRTKMGENPRQAVARDHLKSLVAGGGGPRIALVIVPLSQRSNLGIEALRALHQFLVSNDLLHLNHQVFFDQGNFRSLHEAEKNARDLGLSIGLHADCDSRSVLGIQLADLVAHSAGIMLLAQLGLFNKLVKAGENSGYDPDLDIELDFELWATFRYAFMGKGRKIDPDDVDFDPYTIGLDSEPSGLYIASSCPTVLAQAARDRFGFVYLGCIH